MEYQQQSSSTVRFRIGHQHLDIFVCSPENGTERPTPGVWRWVESGHWRLHSQGARFGVKGSIIHCKRIMSRGHPFSDQSVAKKQIKFGAVTSSLE